MFCTAIRINKHEALNPAYKVISIHNSPELALDVLERGQVGLKIDGSVKLNDTIDSSGSHWSRELN